MTEPDMSQVVAGIWIADLWQDGMCVAAVTAPTKHDAMREISHYARQYEEDGPVEVHLVFEKDEP